MSEQLVPVTRPNGKTYRPRKPPHVEEVMNIGSGDLELYVHGLHDVDRAYQLAQGHWGSRIYAESARQTWIRLTYRDHEPFYAVDTERGAPAVIFEID